MGRWLGRIWFVAVVMALAACGGPTPSKEHDRTLLAGESFSYKVQPLVESDAAVSYEATLADGQPLPGWLQFNPQTLQFSGTAPEMGTAGEAETIAVQVTAAGAAGALAKTSYSVRVMQATGVVPQILNPTEELAAFAPTGILRWSAVAGGDAYEVWAYKDAGLTQLQEFSKALVSRQYQFTQLAADQTYYIKLYYRVSGSWRELPAFSIRTTSNVTKSRLTNSQEELDALGTSATLRWTAVQGADVYELWVYRDANLEAFAEASGPVRITQYQITTLTPGTTYYVQVYARVNGSFTVGGALQVTVTGQLDKARILNPQEELDAFATNGILRWSTVTGATAYELWIFTDPNSANFYEASGSLSERNYATRTLQPGQVYYAQAYSLVNGQWQVGAPVKITTTGQVTKARLTNAQVELEGFSTTGTLRWTEVPGATAYELYIFANAGLGVTVEGGSSPDRSYQVKKVCSGAVYYVQAYALVNGQWTTGWATPLNVTQGVSTPDCVPPAPQVTLTATPIEVVSGQSVGLNWTTKFATSCTASGAWSGPKALSGQETVGPITKKSLFILTCTGQSGTYRAETLVTVASSFASISGEITLANNTQVDSDVNDPNAAYKSNNTAATAQQLPVPVALGGYVSEPYEGAPDGFLYRSGDLRDIFYGRFTAGQVIELVMPAVNPSAPTDDADLYLYNQTQFLVDASEGIGQTERLVIPSDGYYYVEVEIYTGAAQYRLSVGQTSVQAAADSVRLSDAFVAGEVVVTLNSRSDKSASREKALASLKTSQGLTVKAGDPSREMLMTVPSSPMALPASEKVSLYADEETGFQTPDNLRRKLETLRHLKTLQRDPDVRWAMPNWIIHQDAVPNDPYYFWQRWHYEQIQLSAARNLTVGNPNVLVAVVDSGVVAHPDLIANLQGGYDFVRNPADDGDGIDPNPIDPGCAEFGNDQAHGTHVAGTIAATTNNALGVAGVAGGARVMPVRVFSGCGQGDSYDIVQGIRYAAGLQSDAGTAPKAADIINLSLSLGGQIACPSNLADLFAQVRAKGVMVVASAGNNNSSALVSPASCPNVISVSAVDTIRNRAPYSNYGEGWVDVAAPGGDSRVDRNGDGQPDGVYSTFAGGSFASRYATYSALQGTSMAAPHVAGVLALMKSMQPSLTPAAVDSLMSQGKLTDDIGVAGPDELGVGLINAYKAVQAVSTSVPVIPPTLSVTPARLDFGDIGTQAEVVVGNAGTGQLSITGTSTAASQIAIAPVVVDSNGLGRYVIKVSRAGLTPGSYAGWVDFASTAGTQRVSVYLQVALAPVVPNAGYGYLLLLDPATFDTVDSVEGPTLGQRVPFELSSVPSGSYYVISGTDLDNDGYICDDAEACGAYPVSARWEQVRAVGTVTGIDFSVGFDTSLSAASQGASESSSASARASRGFLRPH